MGRMKFEDLPCPFPDCFRCPYPDCIKDRIFSGQIMTDQELQTARERFDRRYRRRDPIGSAKAKQRYHELKNNRA